MKKFVAGVVCAALLFAGVSVSADAIKNVLVGKKVDGVAAVIIDGKKIEKDAITIAGTSYLPVRAMTDAIGGKVTSAKNGKIELVTKEETKPGQIIIGTKDGRMVVMDEAEYVKYLKLQSQIDQKETEIKRAKERIALAQNQIDNGKDLLLTGGGTIPFKESDVYAKLTAEIAKENETIAKLEAEIADYDKQKAALEQQIAGLKK